jgi:hypothetical protein
MPEATPTGAAAAQKPTARQFAFLKDLAAQRGQSFAYPATAAEASREIKRLHRLRRTARSDVARERRQIADDMATRRGDDARVRDAEITGYGSNCQWSHSTRGPKSA